MYEEINAELSQLRTKIDRCRKAETMLADLQSQLQEFESSAAVLKEQMEKENIDLDKISKSSIRSLFYTVLGSREQQEEKERREFLSAKLKYDQRNAEIAQIKARIRELTAERDANGNCEQKYNELMQKKYKLLINSHGETAKTILDLEHEISACRANSKEINEAVAAGKDVLRCTSRVRSSLDNAEGWGTWDLLGGGLLSDLAKHSNLDDAKSQASEVSMLLSRFRSELADVRISNEIQIHIDGFAKFADFFFDGLVADWVVQSKIHDSQQSVENVEVQVNQVLNKLDQINRENEKKINQLTGQFSQLVEKA